jgi:hypothetical protein
LGTERQGLGRQALTGQSSRDGRSGSGMARLRQACR